MADPLTPRELQILRLLCAGSTNEQIASQLGLSRRTVEHHRLHLLRKSGCRTACQLGAWAVRMGFVAEVDSDARSRHDCHA